MDAAHARLRKELLECTRDSAVSGVHAEPVGGDLSHWRGVIRGPDASPYDGGAFGVDIVVPRDYPFTPPAMRFTTKLWHPNVSSQTGAICLVRGRGRGRGGGGAWRGRASPSVREQLSEIACFK